MLSFRTFVETDANSVAVASDHAKETKDLSFFYKQVAAWAKTLVTEFRYAVQDVRYQYQYPDQSTRTYTLEMYEYVWALREFITHNDIQFLEIFLREYKAIRRGWFYRLKRIRPSEELYNKVKISISKFDNFVKEVGMHLQAIKLELRLS